MNIPSLNILMILRVLIILATLSNRKYWAVRLTSPGVRNLKLFLNYNCSACWLNNQKLFQDPNPSLHLLQHHESLHHWQHWELPQLYHDNWVSLSQNTEQWLKQERKIIWQPLQSTGCTQSLPSKSIQFMIFMKNDNLLGQHTSLMMNSSVNQAM